MDERRRYERAAFFCGVDLTVLPNGKTASGRSFDISLGGVGVTTGTLMLERGRTVKVIFHIENGTDKMTEELLGRVAYSAADEDGDRVGIEFLEKISESSHPALIQKLNSL